MSQNSSRQAPLPAPLAFPNSGRWLGSDGNWSTFAIQIGTPPQHFSVLPNPAVRAIFVPDVAGCDSLNITDCGIQRGAEVFRGREGISFDNNGSTTWKELGFYSMHIDSNFASEGNWSFGGNLWYGADRLSSGSSAARNEVVLKEQLVASYAFSDPFWVGQLGLGKRSVDFGVKEYPSFLSKLKKDGNIPSLSFGYQAGAAYRFDRVPASLILGGYDASRVGDSVLSSDNADFAIGLRKIELTFGDRTTITLLENGIMAFIDTSFPDIWLPPTVCDKFAETLNLTYNATANRYTISDDARSKLQTKSAAFGFSLSSTLTRGTNTSLPDANTTIISLPYAAFDLKMKVPGSSSEVYYFPLRQTANESTYALGRAFLQETYFSADLERSTFNLSNAVFANPAFLPNIVPIEPVDRPLLRSSDSNGGSNSSSTTLEPGTIAGIVVSIVVAICCIATLLWWLFMRKQNSAESKSLNDPSILGKSELDTHTVEELPYDTRKTDLELDGTPVGEMHSPQVKTEMDAFRGVEMDAPHSQNELDSPHGRSEL